MNNLDCTTFVAEKIQNLRIAVVGDVMVDRYFYGEVKRISPEAPVPVNHVQQIKSVLGGAANVAANLAGLGCQVFVAGVTGTTTTAASWTGCWRTPALMLRAW